MKKRLYFNTGHVAALSPLVYRGLREWEQLVYQEGSDSPIVAEALLRGVSGSLLHSRHKKERVLERYWCGMDGLYGDLASAVDGTRERIVLQPTFSHALAKTLAAIGPARGSTILATDLEHPTVIEGLRWFAAVNECHFVVGNIRQYLFEDDGSARLVEEIVELCRLYDPRVLLCSHIEYQFGTIIDLGRLKQTISADTVLIGDAAHAVGQLDYSALDSMPDILLGSGHKWLGGPRSSAFVSVSSSPGMDRVLERLAASILEAFLVHPTTRYQFGPHLPDYGSIAEVPFVGLGVALASVRERSIREVTNAVAEASRTFGCEIRQSEYAKLIPRRSTKRSATCFVELVDCPDVLELAERLRRRGLVVSPFQAPRGLRFCLGVGTTTSMIRRALQILEEELVAQLREDGVG